jgi:hypothetical protein
MPFSEDDLRAALKRKDPGPGFTQRVMAHVAQQSVAQQEKSPPAVRPSRGWFTWLWLHRPYPAMAAVAAVLVLAVASWVGFERHEQRQKAMQAEQEAILALRITNAKLNHVFQRVKQSEGNESDSKIRREVL